MGNYPFPGTNGTVHIFGAAYLRLHHNVNSPTLALLTTSPFVPVTDPSVVIQAIQQSDQDYFRLGVGVGVDLIAGFSKWTGKSTTTSSESGSGSGGTTTPASGTGGSTGSAGSGSS